MLILNNLRHVPRILRVLHVPLARLKERREELIFIDKCNKQVEKICTDQYAIYSVFPIGSSLFVFLLVHS